MHIARLVRFVLATVAFCVLALVFVVFGNNLGVNGHLDWGTLGDSFDSIFGGIWSSLAILLFLALLGAAFLAIRHLAARNQNDAAAGVGTVLIILALIVGATWIRVDLEFFGGIGPFVGFLVAGAISTAIIAAILDPQTFQRRRPTTRTTDTTQTTTD